METVHVVAINPYRKGRRKFFLQILDTYDKVIGSEGNQEDDSADSGELPMTGVDLNDAQAVKKVQERLVAAFLLSALRHVQE